MHHENDANKPLEATGVPPLPQRERCLNEDEKEDTHRKNNCLRDSERIRLSRNILPV